MSLVCRNPCRDIPRLLWPNQKNEPIEKFIVDRQEVDEKDARFLSMALSSRSSALKVLYLYKNQISMQSLCTILLGLSSSLGALRQLPSCMLSNLHSAGSLESLYLCVTPLPFPVVQLLSSVLRANDVLKELYLWENQLEENSIVHLSVHGIAANRTLTKLVITRNANMTGRAAAAIVVAFGKSDADDITKHDQIQKQRVLNLSHNKMDADQIQEMVSALSTACLAKLCLDGNPFGNDGARALAEALSHNANIQRLDLARTRMSSTGITVLARRGLVNNQHLQHLVLSHNNINSTNRRCLQAVLEALQRTNKAIQYIDLPRPSVTSCTAMETVTRRRIDYYLALNRAGRLHVCDDLNLNWGLFPWILAGKEANVINYFLSVKPEVCRQR